MFEQNLETTQPQSRTAGSREALANSPAVGVVVTPITHGRTVTHEVLGAPGHNVRLPGRNLGAAGRAQVVLLGAVGGNISHKPFGPAVHLLARSPVCETRYIGGWVLRGPLVLVNPTIARHRVSSPPVLVGSPVLIGGLPASVAVISIRSAPLEVYHRVMTVRDTVQRRNLQQATVAAARVQRVGVPAALSGDNIVHRTPVTLGNARCCHPVRRSAAAGIPGGGCWGCFLCLLGFGLRLCLGLGDLRRFLTSALFRGKITAHIGEHEVELSVRVGRELLVDARLKRERLCRRIGARHGERRDHGGPQEAGGNDRGDRRAQTRPTRDWFYNWHNITILSQHRGAINGRTPYGRRCPERGLSRREHQIHDGIEQRVDLILVVAPTLRMKHDITHVRGLQIELATFEHLTHALQKRIDL